MQRRTLIRLAGAALLPAGAHAAKPQPHKPDKRHKPLNIIVIGAGLAGLAAARELQRHGHAVQVLEARDRIGGRVWTSRQWPDLPLDLGASWIHGVRGNPLSALADEAQAQRAVTRYGRSVLYGTDGKPLTAAEEARLDASRQAVSRALSQAQSRDQDVSVGQAVAHLLQGRDSSDESARFIRFILSSDIEQEYAGSMDALSAHSYDSARDYAGDDALFPHGFSQLTEFLARGLRIARGQVVQRIAWASSPVSVSTASASFSADRVVVTLPLGVLKSSAVRFTPELPPPHSDAIAALGMGVLNKCYLRFDRAFWPEGVDWLEYIAAQHGAWTEWVSFQRALKQPVLLGFNAADGARALESRSDADTIASAMDTLKTLFGPRIPQPVGAQITRWAGDPFSLGSYSFNAVASHAETRRALAQPLDSRLFFAGEATSADTFGTAHGAYLSGLRVAREILAG